MRLIDLDELLKFPIRLDHYDKENDNEHFVYGVETVLEYAENLPVVEAEPVRNGRWIEKPPYSDETVKGLEFQIVCSRCDEQNSSITFDENSVPIAKTFYRTKFCPNCGAHMRKGGADNGNG